MILIITNRQDYTADFLIIELRKRGTDYIRLNTEEFPQRAKVIWYMPENGGIEGYFVLAGKHIPFESIHSVWYRRPVSPAPSAEMTDPDDYEFARVESQAALDGVLNCLDCFWMSRPEQLRRAEFKLYQLSVASKIGFLLSPTLVTNIPESARTFYDSNQGHVVYKTLRQGRIIRNEKVSLIYTHLVTPDDSTKLDAVSLTPSLFQRYIPKQVEIRATVIGSKVFAVAIHSQDHEESLHDWRRGDTETLHHVAHQLPNDVAARCVALTQSLNLAFGAIDLILTPEGDYYFLEINPNGQWAWIQQLCPDIPLRETIADTLIKGNAI